jgi:hypothetical protein
MIDNDATKSAERPRRAPWNKGKLPVDSAASYANNQPEGRNLLGVGGGASGCIARTLANRPVRRKKSQTRASYRPSRGIPAERTST